jgi:PAS domain S-box-containing protein
MADLENVQMCSPAEVSIPEGAVPLESILRTDQLHRRPLRPPDYEKENRALAALAHALVDSRSNILQTLADTILDVTQCDSSGLSLLTREDGGKRFYWPAIAGMWQPHVGGGTPRDFGPCGDVLDRNCTLLFQHFERRYPYLLPVMPPAEECLLVPFYVEGRAVGTIWAIMHSDRRKFDAEDERVMSTLGQFASLAYQTLEVIEDLKLQVAAREKAEAAMREWATGLEAKIRRLVDSNIIGIFIWDLDNRIIDANQAFLRIVGYDRQDLVSGRLDWRDLTPTEWHDADDRRAAELKATGTAQPYEKEYFRKGGGRVPVLVGAASFEGAQDEGVGFVVDLTDRKSAERAALESERQYHEAQIELLHANRVATLGQLSATIAHEVNQPITAVVTNAQAALRWLKVRPLDLGEVQCAVGRILEDGTRASEVVGRIHAMVKKRPPRNDSLDINEAIVDVVALTHPEAMRNGVSVQTQLAEALPFVRGDRVQLQQVILNLIINAFEAMSSRGEASRHLLISTAKFPSNGVSVAVHDSGPGLDQESLERIFNPFYTTKPGGLGMGLSICRSIIEAHGGRLWTIASVPQGAIFEFTVPTLPNSPP